MSHHVPVVLRRPSRRTTVVLLAVIGAVVAAYVAVWLVGLDLAVRPPLPARIQADASPGSISLLGDLTARLAAFGTLGVLSAIVGFTARNEDHTLSDAGRRLLPWAGRLGQVWFAASVLNTFANPAYVNGVPIGTTMRPDAWWTFLWASPSGAGLAGLGARRAGDRGGVLRQPPLGEHPDRPGRRRDRAGVRRRHRQRDRRPQPRLGHRRRRGRHRVHRDPADDGRARRLARRHAGARAMRYQRLVPAPARRRRRRPRRGRLAAARRPAADRRSTAACGRSRSSSSSACSP